GGARQGFRRAVCRTDELPRREPDNGARHLYRPDRRAEIRLPAPRFLAGGDDRRGNAPGRRLTVDSGVFNAELMANRPEAGEVWAKSRLRDRIDAIIAHEDAESLTGDHDLAEAMAPDTTLPITEGARQILRAIRGNPRER